MAKIFPLRKFPNLWYFILSQILGRWKSKLQVYWLLHEKLSIQSLYNKEKFLSLTNGVFLFLRFPETMTAIAFEAQGMYDQAQDSYEQAMKRGRDLHNIGPAPPSIIPEYKLWEEHWCKWVWSNNFVLFTTISCNKHFISRHTLYSICYVRATVWWWIVMDIRIFLQVHIFNTILYTSKFSRCIILAVFADPSNPRKLNSQKF